MLERVENVGGAEVAVDARELRSNTASRWLSSTTLGMVAEARIGGRSGRQRDRRVVPR